MECGTCMYVVYRAVNGRKDIVVMTQLTVACTQNRGNERIKEFKFN